MNNLFIYFDIIESNEKYILSAFEKLCVIPKTKAIKASKLLIIYTNSYT